MRILGIDPGVTTGFAVVVDSKPEVIGEIKRDQFENWSQSLLDYKPDIVVIEDYIMRPTGNQRWRKTETPKLIGRLQAECDRAGLRYVMQQPAIKPVGYGFAGLKYVKGKKGTHIQDAIAHAFFYGVKHAGFRKT